MAAAACVGLLCNTQRVRPSGQCRRLPGGWTVQETGSLLVTSYPTHSNTHTYIHTYTHSNTWLQVQGGPPVELEMFCVELAAWLPPSPPTHQHAHI